MDGKFKVPPYVAEILKKLEENGFQAYVVGGAVRDYFLNVPAKDYDIATDAKEEEIRSLFPYVIEVDPEHGTSLVHMGKDENAEVTSFRGKDPHSLEEDLLRRDFTVDSVAWSPKTSFVFAPRAKEDLQNGILRANGNALDRFEEDPLRILRGIRLSGEKKLALEGKTQDAMNLLAEEVRKAAPERIGSEFRKMIVLENSDGLIRENLNVFFAFIPELKPCRNFNQRSKWHQFDVLEHLLHTLKAVSPRKEALCFAALFHDISKPETFFVQNGEGHFYTHPEKGALKTKKIMTRLRYPNELVDETVFLVERHMFEIEKAKTMRRYLYLYGKEWMEDLISLREADIRGTRDKKLGKIPFVEALRNSLRSVDLKKEGILKNSLKIGGDDLKKLGMEQGKELGDVLKEIRMKVVDQELPNDRDALLRYAEKRILEKKKIGNE
jgi:tRNA nucleotidyltransferase (CCA-adding enzyme)